MLEDRRAYTQNFPLRGLAGKRTSTAPAGLWFWSRLRVLVGYSLVVVLVLGGILRGENRYPIILVHGFMGWGRDEMGGYLYWGGSNDLEAYLREQGFEVYTASVGPVSSNWDRAVELYYQIKGGQVDYGKGHAQTFGIIQKPEGKVFPGLYPQWDAQHPVHLIGHSMGGQTIRMLQYLLSTVIYSDSAGTVPEADSLLGQKNEGWIKSITTLSTPHDGTTLSDIVNKSIPFLQDFIAVAAVVGNNFYDFDLQQWGFERREDESWSEYFRRMRESPAWGTKNISAWDTSLEGARQLNTMVRADSQVYYFSFATSSTVLDSATGFYVPDKSASVILRANARILGRKTAYWGDGTATDSTWYENDGVVNTISMARPTTGLNGPDPMEIYHPGMALSPGRWYFMGKLHLDHKKIIGHGLDEDSDVDAIWQLYRDHCALLWSLPE